MVEVVLAALIGFGVYLAPVYLQAVRPPNYENVVYLPIMGSALGSYHGIWTGDVGVFTLAAASPDRLPWGALRWLLGPAQRLCFAALDVGRPAGRRPEPQPVGLELLVDLMIGLVFILPTLLGKIVRTLLSD